MDTKYEALTEEASNFLNQQCFGGNIEGVKVAITIKKIDPNYGEGEALIYTIRGLGDVNEKKEILKYLKSNGADLKIRNGIALEWAVIMNDMTLIEFLLQEELNISNTLLFYAASQNNVEALSFMLKNSPTINELELLGSMKELDFTQETNDLLKSYSII